MGKRRREGGVTKAEGRAQAEQACSMPQKRFYRQRAHCNPLNDTVMDVPRSPQDMDWAAHFPQYFPPAVEDQGPSERPASVQIADIGCGFGGMTIALAKLFPDTLVVGMEIRDKVTIYGQQRIAALRSEHEDHGYQNAAILRANAMKQLCHYFTKHQLTKMLFLFPDPHFKAANHRRRIINTHLLTEYAHYLQPGGVLYTITDVEELGVWMKEKLDSHPLFQPLTQIQLADDPVVPLLDTATEEGKKVARNGGKTWRACYQRVGGL